MDTTAIGKVKKVAAKAILLSYKKIKEIYLANPSNLEGSLLVSLGNAYRRIDSLSVEQLEKVLRAVRSRLVGFEVVAEIDFALKKIKEMSEM